MKNKIIALLVLFTVILFSSAQAQTTAHKFEAGKNTFLLDGKPFVVKAAELHYTRIPQAYWSHRIEMCKALGMNTICIYIFWNIHEQEEGKFDFSGQNDIAAFCKLAQQHGMYVIVRPGPYVCAEWEMGGLPWWLLKKKDVALRTLDPYYMERVGIFMKEVGKQLAPLQVDKGGNIIMVQVENEYGSYGTDKPYVSAVRDLVRESGFADHASIGRGTHHDVLRLLCHGLLQRRRPAGIYQKPGGLCRGWGSGHVPCLQDQLPDFPTAVRTWHRGRYPSAGAGPQSPGSGAQ